MRFTLGPIPEDPEFQPIEEGWRPIREPDPILMQLLAIPVMVLTGCVLFFVLKFTPIPWLDTIPWIPPFFLLMIPIHELAHALTTPAFGSTRRTYIGLWPSRVLFYAHYEGELSRNRFLAVLAAPTVFLTVVPLALCVLLNWRAPALAAFAIGNGLGAAGDLLGLGILLVEVPRGTTVRNKGWRTYWKPSPP